MATFLKRGGLQWQAKIRRKGFPSQTKTFNTRIDAESWALQIENEMDRGVFLSRKEAENTTLTEALDRYENEVSALKKGYPQERKRIRQWKNHPLSKRFLATLRSADFAKYRDDRLKSVSPTTVRLELAIISHLFEVSRKDGEWKESSILSNPFACPNPLSPGIEGSASKNLNSSFSKQHLPTLRSFSLLLRLGCGAAKSLRSSGSMSILKKERSRFQKQRQESPGSFLSPISQPNFSPGLAEESTDLFGEVGANSISHAFSDACKKAKLEDLRFHDLRHEATSRFFEQGLNVMEVSSITGHQTLQMLRRYTHLKAEDLVKKLDGKALVNH